MVCVMRFGLNLVFWGVGGMLVVGIFVGMVKQAFDDDFQVVRKAERIETHKGRDGCTKQLPPLNTTFGGKAWAIDGDSLCVEGVEVRISDFSAPEWDTASGRLATAHARAIVQGELLACVGVGFSYDRIVARCGIRGKSFGTLMRERGIKEGGR